MADTSSVEFLDGNTLAILSGASLAVTVITNTIHTLLKKSSPWIPFVISLVIVVVVTTTTSPDLKTPMTWLLAFINACLLFCTAAGIQGVISHTTPQPQQQSTDKVRWASSWLRPQQ